MVAAIVWSGTQHFRSSASELMDVRADFSFVNDIRTMAMSVEGVRDVLIHLEPFPHIHEDNGGTQEAVEG